jgi:hypothetical protein
LIDTNIVKEFDLGPVVSSVEDFVENIIKLKNSPDLMKFYRKNIQQLNSRFTWKELSKKMELELAKFEN